MPAATPALIDRVEPNCAIDTVSAAASRASGVRPGPSWPNSSTHRSGRTAVSSGTAPGWLSTPTTGRSSAVGEREQRRPTSGVVAHVLVPVGDHRPPPVPAAAADDVHLGGEERVRRPDDGPDVQVVAEVLDRHVEGVPAPVEVGDDRLDGPVAVAVDDVAPVAVGQQLAGRSRGSSGHGPAHGPTPTVVPHSVGPRSSSSVTQAGSQGGSRRPRAPHRAGRLAGRPRRRRGAAAVAGRRSGSSTCPRPSRCTCRRSGCTPAAATWCCSWSTPPG